MYKWILKNYNDKKYLFNDLETYSHGLYSTLISDLELIQTLGETSNLMITVNNITNFNNMKDITLDVYNLTMFDLLDLISIDIDNISKDIFYKKKSKLIIPKTKQLLHFYDSICTFKADDVIQIISEYMSHPIYHISISIQSGEIYSDYIYKFPYKIKGDPIPIFKKNQFIIINITPIKNCIFKSLPDIKFKLMTKGIILKQSCLVNLQNRECHMPTYNITILPI